MCGPAPGGPRKLHTPASVSSALPCPSLDEARWSHRAHLRDSSAHTDPEILLAHPNLSFMETVILVINICVSLQTLSPEPAAGWDLAGPAHTRAERNSGEGGAGLPQLGPCWPPAPPRSGVPRMQRKDTSSRKPLCPTQNSSLPPLSSSQGTAHEPWSPWSTCLLTWLGDPGSGALGPANQVAHCTPLPTQATSSGKPWRGLH